MKNDCVVSIVIPVYNAEEKLAACLDCLLRQTFCNIEIMCVDDGSTDMSAKILTEYARLDSRIKVIHQENQGAGKARNHGLKHITGQYVIFLDSDDLFEPYMIECMVQKLIKSHADAVICRADSFDNVTGKTLCSEWKMPVGLLEGNLTFAPSERADILFQLVQGWPWDKMFRTDFIRYHNLQYPDLPNSQDLVFVFEALVLAQRVNVVERVLVHRRMNRERSISNSRALHIEAPFEAVMMFSESLKRKNLWEMYRKSFYRWVMNFWLWHFTTLSGEAQKKCFYLMKRKWIPEFDFDCFSKENYDPQDYKIYKRIIGGSYNGYMMERRLKAFLKKILPPPVNMFRREVGVINCSVSELEKEISELTEMNAQIVAMLQICEQRIEHIQDDIEHLKTGKD